MCKFRVCFSGFLAVVMSATALGAFAADPEPEVGRSPRKWVNALDPARHWWQPRLTLARDGWTDYRVVQPLNASPGEAKAAQELAYWLERVSGARFAVVDDESSRPAPCEISVGRTNRLSAHFPKYDPGILGPGGYTVGFFRRMVFILGESGDDTLAAAYAFLSDYVGCRWYAPDATVVPDRHRLRVPLAPRLYTPVSRDSAPMDVGLMDGLFALRNRATGFLVYSADTLAAEWGLRLWQTPANQWVTVNRMNRGDQSVERLLNDFIFGYFGESAGEVARAHRLLRTAWPISPESAETPDGGGMLYLQPGRVVQESADQALGCYAKALENAQSESVRGRVLRDALPLLHFTLENPQTSWRIPLEIRLLQFETGARSAGLLNVPCALSAGDIALDEALSLWRSALPEK